MSAVLHVRSACLPDTIADEDGNIERMTADWSDWETFNPKPVDDTTGRLALLTRVMPLLLVAYHLWCVGLCDVSHMYAHDGTFRGIRDALRVQLGDSDARRRWTYWLAMTYVLPALVNEVRTLVIALSPRSSLIAPVYDPCRDGAL